MVNGSSSQPRLDRTDHRAYLIGYDDGTLRPNCELSRAEAASIFYRLLSHESRRDFQSTGTDYADVAPGAWYHAAVCTLDRAGVLACFGSGRFLPAESITRGQLVQMAVCFAEEDAISAPPFPDVPPEHPARNAIALAARLGWCRGYPDGRFRPDEPVTRAEAMALLNRVLERGVPGDYFFRGMNLWPDCREADWFYADAQEATTSHTYERREEGPAGARFRYEVWKSISAPPDWAALEQG